MFFVVGSMCRRIGCSTCSLLMERCTLKREKFITRADIAKGGRKPGVGDKLPPLTPEILRALGEWKGAGEYVELPQQEDMWKP